MLDTNILIYLSKNRPPQVAERIDALSDEDIIAMSFITWAELLRGAEGSQRREATLQQLEALRRLVPVLYPDGRVICEHYAIQATALKRRATPIGANDLWIACHALAIGATVVSHNVSEFCRVGGCSWWTGPSESGWLCESGAPWRWRSRHPACPGLNAAQGLTQVAALRFAPLARRWRRRGLTAVSFASSAMAATPLSRTCPIRIISVHFLGAAGELLRVCSSSIARGTSRLSRTTCPAMRP